MTQIRKPHVVTLIRVSTDDQDLERQTYAKNQIIRHFGLEEIHLAELKVSGTVVLYTTVYKNSMVVQRTPDCDGMVVPGLDRWFRLKMILLSKWGEELAAYVKPFEVLLPDGKTAKLIYCTLTGQDGTQKVYALDLRNTDHQNILLEAIRYATKERVVIAQRFDQGKESARTNPEMKVDELPNGVEFVMYPGQSRFDVNGRRKTRLKGYFIYNEYAYRVVLPILEKYDAGTPLYTLWKEYKPLAAELVAKLGLNASNKKKQDGLKDINCVRNVIDNRWWLGIKHRTSKTIREFNEETQKYEATKEERTDETRYEVETNLAGWVNPDRPFDPTIPREPLIGRELWDRIQAKLAVGSVEYGKRKKHELDHLSHPLFHCSKCGTIMYPVLGSKTDSKNKRQDVYICGKRRRFTKAACDSPIFRMKDLDNAVVVAVVTYLGSTDWLAGKMKESMNEDHRAAAIANVTTKKFILTQLEKDVRNLAVMARRADDPTELTVEFNKATRELAQARNEVSVAQEAVTDIPDIDVGMRAEQVSMQARRFTSQGILQVVMRDGKKVYIPNNLQELTIAEKKEFLAKNCSIITATVNPLTDLYDANPIWRIPVFQVEDNHQPSEPWTPPDVVPDPDATEAIRDKRIRQKAPRSDHRTTARQRRIKSGVPCSAW